MKYLIKTLICLITIFLGIYYTHTYMINHGQETTTAIAVCIIELFVGGSLSLWWISRQP